MSLAPQPRLSIVPVTWREAVAYVAQHHRHHLPPRGDLFRIGVADEEGVIRGVAITGRPIAWACKRVVHPALHCVFGWSGTTTNRLAR